jgi:hypothetical protein
MCSFWRCLVPFSHAPLNKEYSTDQGSANHCSAGLQKGGLRWRSPICKLHPKLKEPHGFGESSSRFATPSGPQLLWFRADADRRAVVCSRASRVVLGNGNRECFLSDTRRIIDRDIPKRFLRARHAGTAAPKVNARTSRIGRSNHCENRTTAWASFVNIPALASDRRVALATRHFIEVHLRV